MLPDSTCATLRSTHDGRFGRGVSASPETLSRPEAGISDACPRPCDAMPDAPETPEVPEVPGTHPSAAAASCHSSDTLCLLFSLIAGGGIRRQKYTIFRYESPPAAHFRSCFSPRVPACPPPLPAHLSWHTAAGSIPIRRTVSKTIVFVCHVVFLITFVITGTRVPGRYLVKNLGNFSPRVTGTALLLRLTPWHGKCCGGTGLVAML